jgi:hypothetical protein
MIPEDPASPSTEWRRQALKNSRCTFVVWLADQVAHDLLAHCPWRVSTSELIQAIDQGTASELQHDAERFIEKHYYSYPSNNPQFFRTLLIFRHQIQKRLRQTE